MPNGIPAPPSKSEADPEGRSGRRPVTAWHADGKRRRVATAPLQPVETNNNQRRWQETMWPGETIFGTGLSTLQRSTA